MARTANRLHGSNPDQAPKQTNDREPTTRAHEVSSLAEHDGTLFPDCFVAALEDAPHRTVLRLDHGDEAVRNEWEDRSAIVVCGAAWDFGVHRDRFDEAATRYEPELPDEALEGKPGGSPRELVPYAWVGFGHGLTGRDAEPP